MIHTHAPSLSLSGLSSNSLLMLAFWRLIAWHGHSTSHHSLCLLKPSPHWCSCLDCYIMTSSLSLVSDSVSLSGSLSLLMCCVQASVWWWAWCSTSPVLMMRWWTGPGSPSSSSTTTMAGPSPSLPLPSYSKRSVWALCVCVSDRNVERSVREWADVCLFAYIWDTQRICFHFSWSVRAGKIISIVQIMQVINGCDAGLQGLCVSVRVFMCASMRGAVSCESPADLATSPPPVLLLPLPHHQQHCS